MRPDLQQLRDYIYRDFYAEPGRGTGCCLHITTDDFNIRDSDVEFCLEYARERGHDECIELAERLLKLSKRERAELFGMKWCPVCEDYAPYDECDTCRGPLEPLPPVE